MAINFKYKIPKNLLPLVNEVIPDYGMDYIYGIMPEELSGQLKHCSLYMVCEFESVNGSEDIWREPIAIVALNEFNALETYNKYVKKNNGSVLCEIVNRCDNLKVEPC